MIFFILKNHDFFQTLISIELRQLLHFYIPVKSHCLCVDVVRWEVKLFVMPSEQVWYIGIALVATCVLGAVIVGALHLYEKV